MRRQAIPTYARRYWPRLLCCLVLLPLIYSTARGVNSFTSPRVLPAQAGIEVTVAPDIYSDFKEGPSSRTLSLPIGIDQHLTLELNKFILLAPDARCIVAGPGGEAPLDPGNTVLMQGTVEGEPASHAYFSIGASGIINGFVETGAGQYSFGTPLGDGPPRADRLVVQPASLVAPDGYDNFCGTIPNPDFIRHRPTVAASDDFQGPLLITLAIDADSSFAALFPTIFACRDYIVQLVGAVSSIYQRDLKVRLSLRLIRLWPEGGEPFSINDMGAFMGHWQLHDDTTGFDLMHLFSADFPLGYAGMAFQTNSCVGLGFGLEGTLGGSFAMPPETPSRSIWDLKLVAHEIGHTLGAGHTHEYDPPLDQCGTTGDASVGTIMSYCQLAEGSTLNLDLRMHRTVSTYVHRGIVDGGCQPYDCNGNLTDDLADIAAGVSLDINSDGVPDECQDCNDNGILDPIDISNGTPDIDGNGVLDACETDCNGNNYPDRGETMGGVDYDLDANFLPDACDPDCNHNGLVDRYEIILDAAIDKNRNRIPDKCEDCNNNGINDYRDMHLERLAVFGDTSSSSFMTLQTATGISGVINSIHRSNSGGVWDLVVNPADRLAYVANYAEGKVYRFDPITNVATPFIAGPYLGISALSFHTFDTTRYLFVVQRPANRVLRFTADGALVDEFVPPGSSPMLRPRGLTFGPDGHLYVGCDSTDAIYRFDGATGAYLGVFVAGGSGGLQNPTGLLFDPVSGNLWVAATGSHNIFEYHGTTGAFLGPFVSAGSQLGEVWGLRLGPDGLVYVSQTNTDFTNPLVRRPGRIFVYHPVTRRYLYAFVLHRTNVAIRPSAFDFLPDSPNDLNHNWKLDACEAGDFDSDGISNLDDNCIGTPNNQQDSDGDGAGDPCDNCLLTPNPDQRDYDGDGIGDLCDPCPSSTRHADSDGDGVADGCDNCIGVINPGQEDSDGDLVGDSCDQCVTSRSTDTDGDGICEPDDNCPDIANPEQADHENDRIGDICDPDDDNDTVADIVDNCPRTPNPGQDDSDHDGIGDLCCCAGPKGNVDCSPGDAVDIADLTALIDNLFITFTPLCCPGEGNVDVTEAVDIGDLTALIDNLFISFTPLPVCQ